MARIIYPEDFLSQQRLLTMIQYKDQADGANSPLTAFLDQQGIDLTTDLAAGVTAATHDASRALLRKQAENFRQLRDNQFNPLFTRFKGLVQFLKSFYKGNERELGNWGITIDGQKRVVYPIAFADKAALFQTFFTAYNANTPAAESPLKPYLVQHSIEMALEKTANDLAVSYNSQLINSTQESENETQLRDSLWNPVVAHIHIIGDYLKKLYSGSEKALFAWGFTVDDSPRAPKLRTTSLKAGESITNNGVIVGGTFTNTGTGDLHLYRGKTTAGTPQTVHAGESLGMLKGYSTITVVNPDTLVAGKFTVLSSKN